MAVEVPYEQWQELKFLNAEQRATLEAESRAFFASSNASESALAERLVTVGWTKRFASWYAGLIHSDEGPLEFQSPGLHPETRLLIRGVVQGAVGLMLMAALRAASAQLSTAAFFTILAVAVTCYYNGAWAAAAGKGYRNREWVWAWIPIAFWPWVFLSKDNPNKESDLLRTKKAHTSPRQFGVRQSKRPGLGTQSPQGQSSAKTPASTSLTSQTSRSPAQESTDIQGYAPNVQEARPPQNGSDMESVLSQLERLKKLHEDGAITPEEFEAAKRRILAP